MTENNNTILRKIVREKRRALATNFCIEASKLITEKVLSSAIYRASNNIAIYLQDENEVDTWTIIHDAWSKQKNCYLPQINPELPQQLCFIHLLPEDLATCWSDPNPSKLPEHSNITQKRAAGSIKPGKVDITKLQKDFFGILPATYNKNKIIAPSNLDLSITPLVIFDSQCFRMGRGKGFYDYTFAYKLTHPQTKPFLLGIAYEFQKQEFTHHPHDVPMQMIITEEMTYQM